MTDHGSDRGAGAPRPHPARDGVIDTHDLPLGSSVSPAQDDAPPAPAIDSSLVGQGDLPAASARRVDAHEVDAHEVDAHELDAHEVVREAPEAEVSASPIPASHSVHEARGDLPPAPMPALAPVQVRRGGFWPMALGGAVAAGLGAGAAIWAMPHLPQDWRAVQVPAEAPSLTPEIEAAARSAAVEAARAEVAAQRETLSVEARRAATEATEAALAAAPAPQVVAAGEVAAMAEADRRLTALEQRTAAPPAPELEARLAALEARPAPAAPAAGSTSAEQSQPDRLAQMQATLDAQAKRLDELAARPAISEDEAAAIAAWRSDAEATRSAVSDAAQQAEARLSELQAKADEIAGKVETAAKRAEATAAIAALEGVLVSGGDGKGAAGQLQAAGVQPPAPLTVPVPALTDLQRDFPQAARAGLRAALREQGAQGGAGTGIASFLRAQTGARSVTPRAGTDADAVLSRAGAAVEAGDISTALTEIAALPESAKAAMTGWTGPAKAWADAHDALDALKTRP